jgi:hypothetical protein
VAHNQMNLRLGRMLLLLLAAPTLVSCGISGSSEAPEAERTSSEMVPPNPSRRSANFVVNSGFEDGDRHWNPWGGASVQITRFEARHGRTAAYVSTKEPVRYGIVSAPVVGYPRRGERYIVGAWVKASDRPKQVVIRLAEVGGDAPPAYAAETSRRVITRWRFISTTGRVRRRDRVALHVYITVERSIGAGDGIFVDGVRVLRRPPS